MVLGLVACLLPIASLKCAFGVEPAGYRRQSVSTTMDYKFVMEKRVDLGGTDMLFH